MFDDECLNALHIHRKALISTPISQPHDWLLPFEIMCDATDYAVGTILGQKMDKKHHDITYVGKTLIGAQLNYPTTEKEHLILSLLLINLGLTWLEKNLLFLPIKVP